MLHALLEQCEIEYNNINRNIITPVHEGNRISKTPQNDLLFK